MIKDNQTVTNTDALFDDEGIDGTKLMKKSVYLDRLYGQDFDIGGTSNISGRMRVYDTSPAERIRIDSGGIHGYNSGGAELTTISTDGALYASSAVISGSITMGPGSHINADYIDAGTLNASIVNVTNLNATNLTTGTLSVDRLGANTITANKLNISQLSAISADCGTLTAGNISADLITSGTLVVGGVGHTDAIILQQDPGGTGTKLRWVGGSRIWSDNSNNMGYNAIGGTLIFYSNSTEKMQVNSGGINVDGHVSCKSLYLNQGQGEGDIRKVDVIHGFNDLIFTVGDGASSDDFKFRDGNGTQVARIVHNTGKIYSLSSNINLGGTDKSAIMPTSEGYKALYCMESPEVWFMDFVEDKEHLDPLFLEVTEGDSKFIKCDDGTYQVWRRRKGAGNKRFESKTEEEAIHNNKFWSMARVNSKIDKEGEND